MRKKETKQFLLRLHIIFGGLAVIGFVLIANLFYIQISQGDSFREQADGQYVVSTFNSFERGSIIFEEQDGTRITAAGQKSGYKLSVNPKTFSGDKDKIFIQLNEIITIERDTFYSALERENRTYVEVASKIPKNLRNEVKTIVGKNAQLHAEKWRVYPLRGSAAHVLGFLGFRGDEYAGRYGIERTYEDTLKRENIDLYTNFFARIFHNIQNIVDPDSVPEGNIISTIDPQIQTFFEKELLSIQDTWNSESVGGIVMNPQNGEIISLGAYPNFDNNNFSENKTSDFKNPLVENVYEMGSILKPLVVAMGIDSDSISVDTLEYYDHGFVQVEDYKINNFDKRGRGWVSAQDILTQSLKTGMVYI
jgi:cell division protein FtsI/penicillin-binding protein 2